MVEAAPLTWWAVLLLGVTLGLTTCAPVCLPYVGAWVVGRGAGGRAALRDTGLFALGKVLAYGGLGAMAAVLGGWLGEALSGHAGERAVAVASGLAGLVLLYGALRPLASRCGDHRWHERNLPPLLLGVAMGLVPCPTLLGVMAACALSGDISTGLGYGVAFGVGAVVSPLLLLAPLLGWLGRNLLDGRPWLAKWSQGGAGVVLLGLGVVKGLNP